MRIIITAIMISCMVLATACRTAPTGAVETMDVPQVEFISQSDSVDVLDIQGSVGKLRSILTYPANFDKSQKYPIAILFHGLCSNKNKTLFVGMAEELSKKGVASIRFDFNGHGESEGEFRNMTITNELEDAMNVYNYVTSLDWTDDVFMSGHSQGGVVASVLSARLGKDNVAATVLYAAAANIHDSALVGKVLGLSFSPDSIPETFEFWGQTFGRGYVEEFQKLDVLAESAAYDGPVCIIQGDADALVDPSYALKYNEVLPNSELHMMEGTNHDFKDDSRIEGIAIAMDFLDKLLQEK